MAVFKPRTKTLPLIRSGWPVYLPTRRQGILACCRLNVLFNTVYSICYTSGFQTFLTTDPYILLRHSWLTSTLVTVNFTAK